MSDELIQRLVSPHNFDGRGTVPTEVVMSARRIAQLRVKFVTQESLTTREVQQLFDDAAVQAEWIRELHEARDQLREIVEALANTEPIVQSIASNWRACLVCGNQGWSDVRHADDCSYRRAREWVEGQ